MSDGPYSVWMCPGIALMFHACGQLLSLTHDNTSQLRVIGELTASQMQLERELNAQVRECSKC